MGAADYKVASNHQQLSVVDKICESTNNMAGITLLFIAKKKNEKENKNISIKSGSFTV